MRFFELMRIAEQDSLPGNGPTVPVCVAILPASAIHDLTCPVHAPPGLAGFR